MEVRSLEVRSSGFRDDLPISLVCQLIVEDDEGGIGFIMWRAPPQPQLAPRISGFRCPPRLVARGYSF